MELVLFEWCVMLFVLLFSLNESQSLKYAGGCYAANEHDCSYSELACPPMASGRKSRIRLRSLKYGLVNGQCVRQSEQNRNCLRVNNMCCANNNTICKWNFSFDQRHDACQTCSGKDHCSLQATRGQIPSNCASSSSSGTPQTDFNIMLTYSCVNAASVIDICGDETLSAGTTHLVFDGSRVARQKCVCVIGGQEKLHVATVDVRLRKPSSLTDCSSSVVHLNDYNHSCREASSDFSYNTLLNYLYLNAAGEITDGPTDHQLSFGKEVRLTLDNLDGMTNDFPAMVWLMFSDSDRNSEVTVRCNNAIKSSETPAGSSDNSDNSDTSGGVPVAAIIVPILLIVALVAAVIGVLLWRRRLARRARDPSALKSPGATANNVGCEQLPEPVENHSYVSFPGDDTDEYSTISPTAMDANDDDDDDDDGGYATSGDPDLVRTSTGEYNKVDLKGSKPIVLDPNYVRLPPQSSVDEEGEDYSHLAGFSAPNSPSADAVVDTPFDEYAHLKTKGDNSEDQYSHTHALGSSQPRREEVGNDYFILEKTDDSALYTTKDTPIDPTGFQGNVAIQPRADTNDHDYFILEKAVDTDSEEPHVHIDT